MSCIFILKQKHHVIHHQILLNVVVCAIKREIPLKKMWVVDLLKVCMVHPYLIKVDVYWPNKGGTDGCHGKETMLPFTGVNDSFIEIEQSMNPANIARIHTQQLPWNNVKQKIYSTRLHTTATRFLEWSFANQYVRIWLRIIYSWHRLIYS